MALPFSPAGASTAVVWVVVTSSSSDIVLAFFVFLDEEGGVIVGENRRQFGKFHGASHHAQCLKWSCLHKFQQLQFLVLGMQNSP